ncbi:MAG TPA: bifunctional DNA primase/polymerase, partial [Stellaceae bacterium]|nr:bifunctional DNA primase/polymerase [Stellaceae bacterium]
MKHIDPALALRAALDLASAGIRCFPCRADKRPTTPHGFLDATADPAGLRELWRLYPGVLVALPTGAANGIDVLDVDPRHDGDVFLAEVESKLPPTLTLQTLSGGRHLYFIHADGLRNSAGKIA